MRQAALVVALGAACAAQAFAAARVLRLEAPDPDGVRRFLSPLKNLSLDGEGSQTWETVTRTGTFHDPRYGEFEITRQMLLQMVANFDQRTYGQDIFIDVAHKPNDGAAAKVLKLAVEGNKLRALLEWTRFGAEAVRDRGFRYLSAEYHENWQDNERRAQHGAVFLGAGLTIRPVVKGLDPVDPSRIALAEPDGTPPTLLSNDLNTILLQETQAMYKDLIEKLRAACTGFQLSETLIAQLVLLAEATLGKVTDKAAAEAIVKGFEASAKQLAEEIAKGNKDIRIQLAAATGGLDEDGVKRLFAQLADDQAKAKKLAADTLDARRKLLAETITAAAGLPEDMRKELTEAVSDLVTGDMSEDQVRRLAAAQIALGNKQAARLKLAGQGYTLPAGTTQISVDSSNEVKALQEEVDKRLFGRMDASRRYSLAEGNALKGNERLVAEALARFDQEHGARLHREYKAMKLAAGDGIVSDVAVPASFERTVLRESLYQMTGLALCDVGTATFAAVLQLPYSYRDTTAAGIANTRRYEGQAVARAGVIQTSEDSRPLPQKIAFEVSDELRYLAGNGQLDFDILAENARNAVRIIGEDSERLVYNEHLNAADEYGATAVVAEDLELQADGAKKVFVLAQWPVVRPRKVYDLKGTQVGSTVNPVTVTYNSVARDEYDGTGTQAAGTYYVLDYNLGEIYLVNQAGAIQIPADGTAYTISYSYATNVYKFDMDEGANETDVHWDQFLYRFGTRRTAIEDRQYMANVATMSGAVRDLIGQAKQFGANFKRTATDLGADGNVGRIKDVPTWRSFAPGLNAGDRRIVIGERGVVRYRMMKPWQMNALENQKDSNGRFTGKKEAYGDQFIVVHTPTQLKAALTSMVLYSSAARIARAAP